MTSPGSFILVILGVLLLTCCNFSNSTKQVTDEYYHEPDRQETSNAVAEVKEVLAAAQSCNDENDPTGWCETISISFLAKTASPSSKGQRVLVIDQGMQLPSFTRYRNRVLDFLILNPEWAYETTKEILEIPKWSNEILSHILGEKYTDLPARTFKGLISPRLELAPGYIKLHGDLILGTLADLNPKSEFVVASLRDLPPEFCSPSTDEQANSSLKARIIRLSNSLVKYIDLFEINFINMSFGDTIETLQTSWIVQCKKPVDMKKIKLTLSLFNRYFYKKMFSLKDTVIVQAAAEKSIDPAVDMDCQRYDSRIRAGYIAKKRSTLPPLGGWLEQYMPAELRRNSDFIDIFVNSGVDNEDPFEPGPYHMLMTSTGLGSGFLLFNMTTSWAAPLVLSYLIYEKNQSPKKSAREVLAEVKSRRRQLMIDPFQHRQFSIFNEEEKK